MNTLTPSEHAAALGKLGRGKPRAITPEDRARRQAHAVTMSKRRLERLHALEQFYKEHHDGRLP